MNKWYPLLKRIVEGVKNNMEMIGMTMGTIMIPLGFVLLFQAKDGQDNIIASICIVLGMIAVLVAYKIVRIKENREKTDRKYIIASVDYLASLLKGIGEELPGLRHDQNNKGGGNKDADRRNDNKSDNL